MQSVNYLAAHRANCQPWAFVVTYVDKNEASNRPNVIFCGRRWAFIIKPFYYYLQDRSTILYTSCWEDKL